MKIPRDIGGEELARRLEAFGYAITRQTGSHMRFTSTYKGIPHHITIPHHSPLKIGTFNSILRMSPHTSSLTGNSLLKNSLDDRFASSTSVNFRDVRSHGAHGQHKTHARRSGRP